MNESNLSVFVLNNNMTADSAAIRDGKTLAADGLSSQIQIFDLCGSYCDCASTARPYRKLRHVTQNQSFTAISCCNRPLIYCTDGCFNENGRILLDITVGSDCNACFPTDSECFLELTDASVTFIGDTAFFIGAFAKGAYLFDIDGKRLTRLCKTDRNEILTDFISFGNEKYAMSTLKNGIRTVTVSDNKKTQSGVLSPALSLKMLMSEGENVYGLFGQSYIYNRIIPIYTNGVLTLPDGVFNCLKQC